MTLHDQITSFILSSSASITVSIFAFLLAGVYILQVVLNIDTSFYSWAIRRERLGMRAINWLIFGCIFLLFSCFTDDVIYWRSLARLALIFLILSELAYQITVLIPALKRLNNGRE